MHSKEILGIRGRNNSAHIDSELQKKIQQSMEGIYRQEDSVTSMNLASERFQTQWQTSKQQNSGTSTLGEIQRRASRSLTR